jgi:hypothetical protein
MTKKWVVGLEKEYVEYFDTANKVSAFTTYELGRMLPPSLVIDGETCWFEITKDYDIWVIWYRNERGKIKLTIGNDSGSNWTSTNESDVRAQMLIHLLESGLIHKPFANNP